MQDVQPTSSGEFGESMALFSSLVCMSRLQARNVDPTARGKLRLIQYSADVTLGPWPSRTDHLRSLGAEPVLA